MLKKYRVAGAPYHNIHIARVYGTIIEEKKFPVKFPHSLGEESASEMMKILAQY